MEKIFKSSALLVLGIMGCLLMPAQEANPIKLVLPFRIMDKDAWCLEISQNELNLLINGKPANILCLTEKQEQLEKPSPLGRNFVLSFQVEETSKNILDCFSYFVHQMLGPRDTLMVLTPLKSYQIRIQGNKERVVSDIEMRLKEDSRVFKKNKNIAERKLITMINQLDAIMSDRSRSSEFNVQRFKDINRFLYVFPQEFQKFRDLFLVPHVGKYSQILKHFRILEGERWWIHFQQRETSDLVSRSSRIVSRINDYFKEEASHFSRIVSHLEDLLDLLQPFPIDQILDPLIANNICYNVVVFSSMKEPGNDSIYPESPFTVSIMGDVARKCGGRTITAIDPLDGLKKLIKHQNSYFELLFEYNNRGEDLNISLQCDEGARNLVYRNMMTAEEINELVRYQHAEKIRIEGYVVQGHSLKFSIQAFKLEEENRVGIIKVSVMLVNEAQETCFDSTNILRASDRTVSLTLEFPGNLIGNFQLTIQAIDVIANRMAIIHIPIDLYSGRRPIP